MAEMSLDNRYKVDFVSMRIVDCMSSKVNATYIRRDQVGHWSYRNSETPQWTMFDERYQSKLSGLYSEYLTSLILS